VKLIDILKSDKHVFIIMEYCSGGDLHELLKQKGDKFDLKFVHSMMVQLASAIEALYNNKIIHRDLKPQNILLTATSKDDCDGEEYMLKLADFGFARHIRETEMAETMCGSPLYMVKVNVINRHQKY
jgi:serine/threonine-protein kinase ULK/ATG1